MTQAVLEPLFSLDEACELSRLNEQELCSLLADGTLSAERAPNGSALFHGSSLLEFLNVDPGASQGFLVEGGVA